jgi:4-amino-4-deoxy-L-arabinose transferase-like glycosyltransferase
MSRERIAALSIFAAALTVRLIYLWCMADSPLFDSPAMDARLHTIWAWSIAESGGLGPEPYFRAPLYPHFMAVFVMLFGQGFDSFLAIRVMQFALGASSCVLLYDLARRIYGFRTGVLAGGMASVYWVFIYYEGELLLPTLINFFNLSAFWCLHRAVTHGRHTGRWLLVSGVVFGLSAITRPNILVVSLFVIAWLVVVFRRERRIGAGLAIAGFAAGLLLPVGMVTLRNYVVGGDFVVIASQAGVNFYIGNNELSDGRTAVVPGTRATWLGGYQDTIRIAESAEGRKLKPSEVSGYWFGRGFEFLADHPGKAATLYAKKLGLLFNAREDSNNQNIYFFANYSVFLGLPIFLGFWLLAPLGFGGILTNARDRWWWLFAGFVVLYLSSFLPFFVTARYRVPALPFLILLAAVFLVRTHELWRDRRMAALARRGLVVAALTTLVFLSARAVEGAAVDAPSDGHFTLGNAYVRKGEFEAALRQFEKSASYHEPYASRSKMQIGSISLLRGKVEKAHAALRDALATNPMLENEVADICFEHGRQGTLDAVLTVHQIARAYRRRGDPDKAIAVLEKAVREDRDDVLAQIELAEILATDAASRSRADQVYRDALARHPRHVGLLQSLVQSCVQWGELDRARRLLVDRLQKIAPDDPSHREALKHVDELRRAR